MLFAGSFSDISSKYDEVWLIVRSLKSMPTGNAHIIHVPELSPSPKLFYSYLNWRKAGHWNKDTFERWYKPQFLQDMQSTEAQKKLHELKNKAKNKNILICCFCTDESLCHRSIVKQLIKEIEQGQPYPILFIYKKKNIQNSNEN